MPRGSGTSLMVIIAISECSGIVTAGSLVSSSMMKFSGTSYNMSFKMFMEKHWMSP